MIHLKNETKIEQGGGSLHLHERYSALKVF